MKKYELTSVTILYVGHRLHRIKAVKDFGYVKAGELGGWIENEENLSQDDNAWIYDEAMVFGNAKVCDYAEVHSNAKVFGNAEVFGNAKILGNANIFGNAKVFSNANIFGNAEVFSNAKVFDYARVHDKANVYDDAEVSDKACIYGHARVCGNALVYGHARVCDNAMVYSNTRIYGNASIKGDAKVHDAAGYIVFKNFWSSERYFTWTRSNNKWSVGCFYGTGEELIKKAYADSEKSGREYERVVRYVESILADEKK